MSVSYAAMTTLVRNKLNQAATTVYTVTDISDQIKECLKEFATYQKHIVPVVRQIESRYGTCSSTSADNLIDTTKGQFLSTDPTNQKVIHNTTDNTWAVISSFSTTAQIGLTGDIFIRNENYRIYNRQCWNQRQLYIGDVPENYEIESVEYPAGQRRNWKIHNDEVLEVAVDAVNDSNASSAITTLPNVDVVIRFNKSHVLSSLTDFAGKMSATAAAAATSIALTSLQSAGTIDVGTELTIQYHRSTYIVAASATIAASAVTLSIYPPLERAVASTAWTVAIRETSLKPQHEDVFADLVAARLSINKSTKYFNVTTIAPDAAAQYFDWGNDRLAEVLTNLRRLQQPKVKRSYPTEL